MKGRTNDSVLLDTKKGSNGMIYSVIAVTSTEETKEMRFETYREALWYATDFRTIRTSQILKNEVVVADFSY